MRKNPQSRLIKIKLKILNKYQAKLGNFIKRNKLEKRKNQIRNQ